MSSLLSLLKLAPTNATDRNRTNAGKTERRLLEARRRRSSKADVVTPFQVDTYRSSRAAGTLPLLWFTFAIAGPSAEEIVFRGFLYRGFARGAES